MAHLPVSFPEGRHRGRSTLGKPVRVRGEKLDCSFGRHSLQLLGEQGSNPPLILESCNNILQGVHFPLKEVQGDLEQLR